MPSSLFAVAAAVALLPSALYVAGYRTSRFPFIALVGLFYAAFFALPPFLVEPQWWNVGHHPRESGGGFGIAFDQFSARTALIVLGGVATLMLGYYGAAWPLRPAAARPATPTGSGPTAAAWIIAVAYLAFLHMPALRDASLAQAMTPLGYLAIGWLARCAFRKQLTRIGVAAFGAVLVAILIAHVSTGLVTPAILLMIFVLTVFLATTKRVLATALCVVLCLVLIFPAMKLATMPQFGAAEPTVEYPGNHAAARLLRRVSLVTTLEHVVRLTPDRVPYWNGETLRNLVTNPIPRVVWPDKPREELGQWFGHQYRLLNPDDRSTSYNLPWLIELYINFGLGGALIGMGIIGALLAALERLLLSSANEFMALAGWALLFPLSYQASNLSLMLGGLPTQAVFLLACAWALSRAARAGVLSPRRLVEPVRMAAAFLVGVAALFVTAFGPKDRGSH